MEPTPFPVRMRPPESDRLPVWTSQMDGPLGLVLLKIQQSHQSQETQQSDQTMDTLR